MLSNDIWTTKTNLNMEALVILLKIWTKLKFTATLALLMNLRLILGGLVLKKPKAVTKLKTQTSRKFQEHTETCVSLLTKLVSTT